MNKKVLFSPIGGTDPISNFHDGPMLHILRVYKPDIIYLYLSKDMCEFQEKDNRYLYCIEQLGIMLNQKFQVYEIKKPELVDVQKFDDFLDEFMDIISQIVSKHKAYDLYLNVSSGTPAMKSSLQIIATLSEDKMIPIQVSTPSKRMNLHSEDRGNYDLQVFWELNEDNKDSFKNRCIESEGKNLLATVKREIIKKHIDAYDYVAAHSIAEDMTEFIDEDVITLLKAANYRLQLDFSSVDKLVKNTEYVIFPIEDYNRKIFLEYLLYLKIKLFKEEYSDFMRGITPIIVEVFENIVKKHCNISINDYYTASKNKNGIIVRRWDRKKLEKNQELLKVLDEEFKGGIKEKPIASYHLAPIIKAFCEERKIIDTVNELKDTEQLVRNLAAHEMISVTDEWIQKKTCFTSEQILNKIKYLAQKSGVKITDQLWNSYDDMNDLIKTKL